VTGTLLPSIAQLRDVGIPLLVVVVFGATFLLLLRAAVQHYKRVRATE
jgi:hypothetical protein